MTSLRWTRTWLGVRILCLMVLCLTVGSGAPALAKIFHSREGAFKLAFPGADDVLRKHIFLTGPQLNQIRHACRCDYQAKLLTVYIGKKDGETMGYAYIDTHQVRTLSETFMVVLDGSGSIRDVHILAFHEPPEYMPRKRWLAQFRGRRKVPGKPVAGIAGATMSAQAITRAVARIVATHRAVGLAPKSPQK